MHWLDVASPEMAFFGAASAARFIPCGLLSTRRSRRPGVGRGEPAATGSRNAPPAAYSFGLSRFGCRVARTRVSAGVTPGVPAGAPVTW